MFCKNCGNKTEESHKFCVNCGDSVISNKNIKPAISPLLTAIFLWVLGIGLMIFGMFLLFGFELYLDSGWDKFWFVIKIIFLLFLPFNCFSDFVEAVKEKSFLSFLYEEWLIIIILLGLIWVLFADGII